MSLINQSKNIESVEWPKDITNTVSLGVIKGNINSITGMSGVAGFLADSDSNNCTINRTYDNRAVFSIGRTP